jgi:hypothetical protein
VQPLQNPYGTDHQSDTDDAFDWLEDPDTPTPTSAPPIPPPQQPPQPNRRNSRLRHRRHHPLNRLHLAEDTADRRSLCDHIEHVNDLLEYIDNETAPTAACSPSSSQHDPARQLTKDTILGQWLIYTTTSSSVAELEAEIANSRDVSPAKPPPFQLSSTGRMAEGKPLLFPRIDTCLRT